MTTRCSCGTRHARPQYQPMPEPVHFTRRDLIEIVVGVPVLTVLLFGLPLLIWLIAGGQS
jgi:hypothetical protein